MLSSLLCCPVGWAFSSFLLFLEPNFVSSYDIGNFTYFFFRENAVEHDCGKTVFSRAARVCKNDIGGRFLLEDTWTTFMKARLNCSRPGEVPFYYHELQGTFFLPELDLIYGIFTTNVYVTANRSCPALPLLVNDSTVLCPLSFASCFNRDVSSFSGLTAKKKNLSMNSVLLKGMWFLRWVLGI